MPDPIGMRVIMAVAEKKGVDPIELPPLSDAIDPDALDALFDPGSSGNRREYYECELRFWYAGQDIHIHNGDLTVDEIR